MKKTLDTLKSVFSKRVEEHANENGVSILESIQELHEEFGIEIEDVKKVLHDHVLDRLNTEAIKLNLLKRPGTKVDSSGLVSAFE